MEQVRATFATPPSGIAELGATLTETREAEGVGAGASSRMSIRELARRAGVSAAQISRIESGQVLKPSREILVALGRALNRNPLPLLILANHLTVPEAREALRPLFRDGAELPEEWGPWAARSLEAVRSILEDSGASEADVRTIAADVFRVAETDETLWDESYALALARGSDAAELRELMTVWRFIGPRRGDLLEYGRSLRRLVDLEYRVTADTIRADAELATTTKTNNEKEQS